MTTCYADRHAALIDKIMRIRAMLTQTILSEGLTRAAAAQDEITSLRNAVVWHVDVPITRKTSLLHRIDRAYGAGSYERLHDLKTRADDSLRESMLLADCARIDDCLS